MIGLNGKSYSLPLGMVFKKYHCAKCGTTLERERTHRVVTKDDQDYYQYHSYGKFPRRDYDVYDYRFKCPGCGARISFDEQRIIERIQKKQGHMVLSSSEIKNEYEEEKTSNHKLVLLKCILLPLVFAAIIFAILCVSNPDRNPEDFLPMAAVAAVVTAIGGFVRHKGTDGTGFKYSHSFEKEALLKKLHTYSTHNRSNIAAANKCYCFHCKAVMKSREILRFADDGQTAICPKCGIDSILPDSIDEPLDTKIIAEMHEYWF